MSNVWCNNVIVGFLRQKLLSLRSQDRKSNARVQAMLKRTKAANKAVLDEARNSLNTAVTAEGDKLLLFILHCDLLVVIVLIKFHC